MKTALAVALFGALLAVAYATCPYVAYHSCVKEEKPTKCKAVQVCEDGGKEKCGDKYCEYPHVCASLEKKECIGFLALKEKCGSPKKVCKEVKKPCGPGACSLYQDCVKETVCKIAKYGRKLMGGKGSVAKASAEAVAVDGGVAHADATAAAIGGGVAVAESKAFADGKGYYVEPYYEDGVYYPGYYASCKDGYTCHDLVCEDKYTCVAKEPCKDVIVKKCVKKEYVPGIDVCHGGYDFVWYALNGGEKCGDEYCGYGYECAEVYIQKCTTKCGYSECGYGYECVEEYDEKDCDKYAYLASICKDVYEPVCVALSPYYQLKYKAPCKTVYVCEKEESECGNKYCPYGYVCAIDYKKSCSDHYYPVHGYAVYADPVKCPKPVYYYGVYYPAPKGYYPHHDDYYYGDDGGYYYHDEPKKGGAAAKSHSAAAAHDDVSVTYTDAVTYGNAVSQADAVALTPKSGAASGSYADPHGAAAFTDTAAKDGGKAKAGADAESYP